jgi:small subunit ribosomal protein S9
MDKEDQVKTEKIAKSAEKAVDKTEKSEKTEKAEKTVISYYEAVGRRREATARVRLYVVKDQITISGVSVEKGAILVNGRPSEKYFPGETCKRMYQEPFRTTNTMNRFATTIKTSGGGLMGQLDAIILGISRALEKVDKEKYRPILKKRGFMTRDPRAKQRRKAGFAGKARARKQSPKR